jgi:hypothetical protein
MNRRLATFVVAFACLAMPAGALAQGVLIEGFGGWQGLQPNWGSVKNAANGNEGTALVGGNLLLEFGGLGVGVSVDKTVSGNYGQPWAGSILAGFSVPVTILRLEVLGELGRRATTFGDMFNSNGATFICVRPGVRFKFGSSPLSIGAAALIRWPTSGGDFGSPDWGLVGRLGLEFP